MSEHHEHCLRSLPDSAVTAYETGDMLLYGGHEFICTCEHPHREAMWAQAVRRYAENLERRPGRWYSLEEVCARYGIDMDKLRKKADDE